jgi:endonuclease/exonuclease/phosphatase family metal-dependent hydrolase
MNKSAWKILLSNLGYARGINGSLVDHVRYAHRHVYCLPDVQKKSLRQLSKLIALEDPDICCFVEIDKGSFTSAGFNQLEELIDEKYGFFDIENKYAPRSRLRSFFITKGKSNAFLAKRDFPHEKIHFACGVKRLIYKIRLAQNLTLFFAHFALSKPVRTKQILEIEKLIRETKGEVIFMGDFNILTGMREIEPLINHGRFILLNREDDPTFTFHKRKLVLDLCVCSKGIAKHAHLKVVPQPYSDHAALVLNINAD